MKYFLLLSTAIHLIFFVPIFLTQEHGPQFSYKVSVKSIASKNRISKNLQSGPTTKSNITTTETSFEVTPNAVSSNEVATEAQVINIFDNYYPENARENSIEGIVELKVFITKEGTITQVDILKSSNFQMLDLAAINAVKNSKIIPATQNQNKIDSEKFLKIEFKLRN